MGEARIRKAKGLPAQGQVTTPTTNQRRDRTLRPVRVAVPMDVLVAPDGSVYERTPSGLHRVVDPRVVEAAWAAVARDNERLRQLAVEGARVHEAKAQ